MIFHLRLRLTSIFLFIAAVGVAQRHSNYNYTIQKETTGKRGAVVSAHPLASKAGLSILQKGGNAVDAAIATQLALAVVYPGAGNLGGGGFLVAHLKNGRNIAIDYREKAPAAASRDMYLDSTGNPMMERSQNGALAAGVPGTVAGLFASLRYARLPFNTLVGPAIDLAENGFAITASQANSFNSTKEQFIKYNSFAGAPLPAFVRNDRAWKAGDTLIQKDLANTLKRMRDHGQKGFYEGETARLIVEQTMKNAKGIISADDLKNYAAKERAIMKFNYKGYVVLTMPLPSSGGVILQQMLKMIEHRNIGAMKFQTPQSVQLMTEAERRAYADRADFLGDPDMVKVPVNTLTSAAYLSERMKDFVPGKAGSSDSTKAGLIPESMETTHLSIIDAEGNAVSVTTTLNGSYGSKTVVAGAGFLLNNEMDDFSVKPGVPNMYGAVGNEKNAIAPNKRMLSSMTPTIVLKNGAPYLVAGTPGGTTIPTSVFQTLVNVIDFNMRITDAVNKPKFHHQWLPDEVVLEKGFDQNTEVALQKMGYKITHYNQLGRTEVIQAIPRFTKGSRKKTWTFTAVADHRGDDDAQAF